MNIPNKAIGAAEEAWYEAADLEAAIKAAAPFIAAQALRDAAEDCNCGDDADLLDAKADASEGPL